MSLESNLFDLTLNQQFEVVKYERLIESLDDTEQLKQIAKLLLTAYQRQRAATRWVLNEHMKLEFER